MNQTNLPKSGSKSLTQTQIKRGWGWFLRSLFLLVLGGTVLSVVIIGGIFVYFAKGLPDIITVGDYRPRTVTQIYASGEPTENNLIGEFYTERRYVIPYEKMPDHVIKAFIAAEDDSFFQHQGINPLSILRAAIANFRAGQVAQGGSTITQQVAKSLLLTPERSYVRKIREVILASRIEAKLTKDQILFLYLNQIYLGHGAYGVQAAAKVYFHKDVTELSLAEAAILAGLPQAPSKYSPNQNPKRAKERQMYVLRRMLENRFITQSQYDQESLRVLQIFESEDLELRPGAYYVENVRRYLISKYGEKTLYEEGLQVTVPTTPTLLKAATQSLRDGLIEVAKRRPYSGPIKKLKPAEWDSFVAQTRKGLYHHSVEHHLLTADGKLELPTVLDSELVKSGHVYSALVTNVDDKRKTAEVSIGGVSGEIPLSTFRWARLEGKSDTTHPSQIFAKGDVVRVRLVKWEDKKASLELVQDPETQGALVSFDIDTGKVLAVEGGYDYKQSEFNRATQASRQPGSAFKPFIYAAAIEKGYNPATIIADSPIVYQDDENGKWRPENFEEKFFGDTSFRQALIKSRNVPTIKIVQDVQVKNIISFAQRLGLTGQFNADLSIALGSGGVSPFELTRAYGVFARLGRKLSPVMILSVKSRDGEILEEANIDHAPDRSKIESILAEAAQRAEPAVEGERATLPPYPSEGDPAQVMDPRAAYVMTHLMKEVVQFGTGAKAKALGRFSAGKTGTTNDYIDAWFVAFTANVVTGVWVGNDNLKPIGSGEAGAKAALPIWLGYMQEAVKAYPESDFMVPPGVVFATLDANTGRPVSPGSTSAIKEAFIDGTQPPVVSDKISTESVNPADFLKEDIE